MQKITEKARKVKMIRGKPNYHYDWNNDSKNKRKSLKRGEERDDYDL
jgi:hypothetical protein